MKLQHKIPLYVVAAILLVGGIGSLAILSSQSRASTHQFEESALVLTDTIRNGLEMDMLRGDRDHVKGALDNLSRHETIRAVNVVGANGKVWASSKGAEVGSFLDGELTQVMNGDTTQAIFGDPSNEFMSVVAAVPAKDECLLCHGSIAAGPNEQGNLGAIRADIDTTFLKESLTRTQQILIVVGGMTFVLVTGTLVMLMRRTVLSPLARITNVASRITRGDYAARVPDDNPGNELSAVAVAFNKMVGRVEQHTLELEDANRQLARTNRMKSEFLANMSHELRTPLNVIIGFSEVLRDTPGEELTEQDRREFCDNIVSSGYHLLELINDVLDLAKVEAGQMQFIPEEFRVVPVLNDVVTTMQPLAAKKGIELSLQVSENLSSIYADVNKFKQVLYNLMGNAVKFTPNDGSVSLSAIVMGSMARFAVADTGIGIAPSDHERIFSEFHQVDGSAARQFEGTGLGLALSKKFVEMQSGEIWVESEVGLGSTFYFTMPIPLEQVLPAGPPAERLLDGKPALSAALSKPKRPKAAKKEAAVPSLEPPNVLVVEDDPKTAELIGLWLSQEGYRVDFAADGVQALEKAQKKEFFAVCLDIMLPRKDGWQVLHSLKTDPQTAETGVIICSALDNPDLGFALGAADYCVKPLSRRHLLDKLNHLQMVSPVKRSTPQVLVADSDQEAAAMTASTLERQGFTVIKAHTGADAKELALEHNPDVILLDMALEGLTCYEVVSFVCKHPVTIDTPIIVTTSRVLSRHEEEALLAGHVQKIIRKENGIREQLLCEMFRLEKLNPERARLVDPETRLFNRRYFDKRLAEEIKRSERYSLDMSILLIEVDRGSHSPASHYDLVIGLAGVLRANIRAADPLARFDANRFAVLLPETPEDAGYKAAQKIVDIVRGETFRDHEGNQVDLTVSVAVIGNQGGGLAPDEVGAKLMEILERISRRGGDACLGWKS